MDTWITDFIGTRYSEEGWTPEEGFFCFSFADYIYRKKFQRRLPQKPMAWRRMFIDLGWPTWVEPYDLIIMTNDDGKMHVAVAVDEREMIHAREDCESVVQEPIRRYESRIRTVARLRT